MNIQDLEAALNELEALSRCDAPERLRGWPIDKALRHCAQSIDASIEGFPQLKPALIRKTIGRLVARRFLAKGSMSHDIESPIPGALDIGSDGDIAASIAVLQKSIERFRAHEGALAPHFVFDALDKAAYGALHAMHIADHLRAIRYR
jgi:hypothetical protein